MQKANLYIKDWLSIHPYTRQQPSDNYFVQLANRLFHICPLNEIPQGKYYLKSGKRRAGKNGRR